MTTVESREARGSAEPEVRTAAGAVRGRREDGLAVFRGIPFAEPPVGAARFAAPRPVRAWDGVREAFSFGPPAPQDSVMAGRSGGPELPTGDDWLTVNVWTPDPDPEARRPVMVWIHGGAYKLGFSGSPGYDARHIAQEGDLVVVTLNYRLGIEGFAHIEGAPANRGLLDQVAALEWVRENIAAFGGDPDQVTVVGESAGAGSIAALLAMPSAAGLFGRAVAQSVPGTFLSDALARDVATALAAELGLRPTVDDLSGVDPRQLPAAGEALSPKMRQYEDRWGRLAHTLNPFSPIVDGEVLPTTPWQALADGVARDIELIVGHNRDEFRLFVALSGQLGKIGDEQAAQALRVFGPAPDGERAYREAFPEASAAELYELVQSDWLFRMPVLHLADAQVAGGGRAHVYELTWQTPGSGGALGACHGLDGPLLFGTLDAHLGPVLLGPEPSSEARALSARFRSAWTAFAATGDPGWPAYDNRRRTVQVFDADPRVTPYPEETSRSLWQDHTFGALPLSNA
ncbi:carboxylesterase family protein [Streptomyces montanus]|uniref:Carboxylic ester hydrolase n=1 Tax=Streptomyces montanus TaxID=2580423 RepID=A0A5R9FVW8_9ACTN|nr:carboxylesterase family protein [Streptomyces montanus]TLS48137.1 carboxylesterase family protein [Streptomyces montanus]